MFKKSIKNHLILFLIGTIFLSSITAFATSDFSLSTDSTDSDFYAYYASIKNIQKQLNSISTTIYTNKREDKSVQSFYNDLLVFESQINQLSSSLSAYPIENSLNTIYTVRLETLSIATRLLNTLIRSLKEQLVTTNTYEEYQLLKAYIVADSLLNQTLSYFPASS